MKKTKISMAMATAIMLSTATVTADDHQSEDTIKLSMGQISVKMGHSSEFRDGLAAWKECYLENGGERNWSTYERMDGDSGSYYVNFSMSKWAELDEDNPASEACSPVVRERITPHIKSSNWRWAEMMPEVSKDGPGGNIALVYFFRVGNDMKFNSVLNQVSEALEEVEGDQRGYWYQTYGGDEYASDYLVAITFDHFAEWDEDEPAGVWSVAAEHYGEEKAVELRAEFRKSVDAMWDYTYRRIDELSNLGD